MKIQAHLRLAAAALRTPSPDERKEFAEKLQTNVKFFSAWKNNQTQLTLKFNGDKLSIHELQQRVVKALARLGVAPVRGASGDHPVHAIRSYSTLFANKDIEITLTYGQDLRGSTARATIYLERCK